MKYAAACVLVVVLATGAPGQTPRGAHLTEQQSSQVRQLVRRTQAEVRRLEALLDQRRQQLAEGYMRYELRPAAALQVREEIVRIERDLLAVHDRMHTHLRTIVTKEQFETMKARVGAIVGDRSGRGRQQGGK